MKAKLQGVISSLTTDPEKNPNVILELSINGAVDEAGNNPNPEAKKITGKLRLMVKQIVAEQLTWGQKVYVTVSTNEFEE